MKRELGITRRRFLLGLAGTGAAFLLSGLGIRLWSNIHTRPLESAFGRIPLLRWQVVGQKYLANFPGEADFDRLVNGVFGPSASLPSKRAREVHEFLRSRVQGDFEKGSVVLIEGWILSQTEAKLAALAALDVR